MFLRLLVCSIAFVLPAFSASVLSPDFFPFQAGNQWVLRSGSTGAQITVRVDSASEIDGQTWYSVSGFAADSVLLRKAENGSLVLRREDGGETLAVSVDPTSEEYSAGHGSCGERGQTMRDRVLHTGPLGQHEALHVRYRPTTCADAGLDQEIYAPGLGLLRRTLQTFTGPQHFNLVYARVGAAVWQADPEVAFGMSLSGSTFERQQPSDALNLNVTLRLTVRRANPVRLRFPSGQRFDLALRNSAGETVIQWSEGMVFTAAFGEETISDEFAHRATLRLSDRDGRPLPDGDYAVEGWLTTTGVPAYRVTSSIAIRTAAIVVSKN